MKIWFDILTPKQFLFFEPMIKKLQKNNTILCSSRNYREVVDLAKIRGVKLIIAGKHGGGDRSGKLYASLRRMSYLLDRVEKFSPDLTVSFCSPEAARISYGLGIKHVAFCDAPHAEAVMRLSVPLIQKLLIPWVIPKKEFTKYGISEKNIIQYKAIDAAVIIKGESIKYTKKDFSFMKEKTILVRTEESQAAYVSSNKKQVSKILNQIIKEFPQCNIVVLGRYTSQIYQLQKEFGNKVIVMKKVVDGKGLLGLVNVFVGSGGTMTAESALMGIPTISYDAVPNIIEQYLVKIGLVKREKDPKKMAKIIRHLLKSEKKTAYKAKKIIDSMEDPFEKFLVCIKSIS